MYKLCNLHVFKLHALISYFQAFLQMQSQKSSSECLTRKSYVMRIIHTTTGWVTMVIVCVVEYIVYYISYGNNTCIIYSAVFEYLCAYSVGK